MVDAQSRVVVDASNMSRTRVNRGSIMSRTRVNRGSCTGFVRVCTAREEANGEARRFCRTNSLNLPTVRISPANWVSTLFNAWAVQIILAEQLQIPVEVVQYDGDDHQYYEHAVSGEIKLPARAYNWEALARASVDRNCSSYPINPKTPDEECSHAMLELWSGQDGNRRAYIGEYGRQGKVEYAGALGALGRIGWFVSNRVLDDIPQFASFRGLREPNQTSATFRRPLRFSEACEHDVSSVQSLCAAFVAEFVEGTTGALKPSWTAALGGVRERFYISQLPPSAHTALTTRFGKPLPSPFFKGAFITDTDPASGEPTGTLLSVPCSWTEHEAQIISANRLALRRRRLPWSEITQALTAAEELREAVLFYGWEPSSVVASGQYSRVSLPRFSSACQSERASNEVRCAGIDDATDGGGCDYPIEVIYKVVAVGLTELAPAAEQLIRSLQITTEEQSEFLRSAGENTSGLRDATCKWVRERRSLWENVWLKHRERTICKATTASDGTTLVCGANGGGVCTSIEPPYPQGRCQCNANFAGTSCELCASGFHRNPLGGHGLQCMACTQASGRGNATHAYARECSFVELSADQSEVIVAAVVSLLLLLAILLAFPSHGCNRSWHRAAPSKDRRHAEVSGHGEPAVLRAIMCVGAVLLAASPLYFASGETGPTPALCCVRYMLHPLGAVLLFTALSFRSLVKWRTTKNILAAGDETVQTPSAVWPLTRMERISTTILMLGYATWICLWLLVRAPPTSGVPSAAPTANSTSLLSNDAISAVDACIDPPGSHVCLW